MAIAVEALFPGATTDQYDAAVAAMGLSPGGEHPGALFHWATYTDEGVRVTDVWASREEFERFLNERIAPVGQSAGLPTPQLTYIDVHSYMTGRSS